MTRLVIPFTCVGQRCDRNRQGDECWTIWLEKPNAKLTSFSGEVESVSFTVGYPPGFAIGDIVNFEADVPDPAYSV